MKKITLLSILLIILSSCDKEVPEQTTSFINLTFKFDTDGEGVKGRVYLFDIGNNKFNENYYVQFATNPPVMMDVNGEYVYPVYSGSEMRPRKGSDGKYINETKHSIFWHELRSVGQSNDFLVVVRLSNGGYQYSSLEIEWNNKDNLYLSKTFTRDWDIPTGHNREAW